MQGFSSRPKTTLAVLTGVTAGLGIALLSRKTVSTFLLKYLCSSHKPEWNMSLNVASNETQCETIINKLRKDLEVCKVVGFDCEWVQVQGERKPVALIQLATRGGECGLFQVHLYPAVPSPLKDLLEDRAILKVGVDPVQDAKYLLEDYKINVVGTFDLRHLADPPPGKEFVGGLASIVNSELGVELPKKFSVRVSDWEVQNLTSEQKEYAAKDALAAVLVYHKLIGKKVKIPFFSPKGDQWSQIYEYCAPLIDLPFKQKKRPPLLTTAEESQARPLQRSKSGQPSSTNPSLQGKRSYKAFSPRKSPLYVNAFMLAPDGEILCTCDTKKAEWYISKGLATVVEQEPLKIKLSFEPSGRVQGPSAEYYTLEKENQCVACGKKDSYVRKKIVPHEYRRYFPDCMKKHQSHDVLLLCGPCHAQSNIADFNLRMQLSELCDAPITSEENAKIVEDNKNKTLRSAARALLNKSNKLPEKRKKELIDSIQKICQTPVTEELLNKFKDMNIMVANEDYTPHGLLVVEYFARDGIRGLMTLEKMWREHFINVMAPSYLPPLWSIDHYHENEQEFTFDSDFLNRIKSICLLKRK